MGPVEATRVLLRLHERATGIVGGSLTRTRETDRGELCDATLAVEVCAEVLAELAAGDLSSSGGAGAS